MRRIILTLAVIIVAVGLLFGLFYTIATRPGRRVMTWRVALEEYLTYKKVLPWYTESIVAASHAQNPDTFAAYPGLRTYSDIDYYLKHNKVYEDSDWEHIPPYTPETVVCVLLEHPEPPTAKTVRRVVFVNYYRDMYTGSWIIHESQPAPFSAQLTDLVTQLECDLDLN